MLGIGVIAIAICGIFTRLHSRRQTGLYPHRKTKVVEVDVKGLKWILGQNRGVKIFIEIRKIVLAISIEVWYYKDTREGGVITHGVVRTPALKHILMSVAAYVEHIWIFKSYTLVSQQKCEI